MSQQPQEPVSPILSLPSFSDSDLNDVIPPPRPWWRRRGPIITIGVVLLLLLVGGIILSVLRGMHQAVTYDYQKVYQSDFSLTVSATGPLQSGTYNVVFSGSGKLSEVDVKVGQTVKQGQTLAKLDKTSLQDALDQAQAAVLTAQTALGNGQASYNGTLGQSQANVNAAQTGLKNAQTSLGKTQTQSQASINAAQTTLSNDQTNLTNTQAETQASISAAQTTLNNDQANLSVTQAESQASISAAQTALNNAQTSLSKTLAQSAAQVAVARTTEQNAIAACNANPTPAPTPVPTPTPTPNCVELAQQQYQQVVAQTNAANATAQDAVNTAQKQLTTARTQADANNTAAQAKVSSDQQALTSTQTTGAANVSTAQSKISSDQKTLASTQAQSDSSNTTAQGQVNTAQSQVNTAQANAGSTDTTAQGQVNTAQSQVNTALVGLQTAQHNLDNATLTASHDGIVAVVNGTVGGTPGASSTSTSATTASGGGGGTFVQIIDTSVLQVLASVNESDAANLKVGEPVQFTVSAYGDRLFRGTVSAISPNGQTVSNVVTYPVTIDVDMSSAQGVNLLPGMTANVTITVVQRKATLLIPVGAINFARTAATSTNNAPAIISRAEASAALAQARQMLRELESENSSIVADSPIPAYVVESSGKQFVVKPVVLGLTDDTTYEVLQGLSAGETIIVGVHRG